VSTTTGGHGRREVAFNVGAVDKARKSSKLKSDGYSQIETKDYTSRPGNEAHRHDFAVRGLVLEGAFTVVQNNESVTYRAGQVFTIAFGIPHSEEIGPQGAGVLFGRKN
jgi:quercetin dioxygenase-like cupin family protein